MRIPRVLGGGLAAVVLSAAWLVAGPGIGAAGASCVGPQLQVAPTVAAPGQSVTVAGLYFGDDCNDTGGPGPVLGQPLQDIELWMRVGDEDKLVALVDASRTYDFAIQVPVPPSLGTGAGAVTARVDGRPVTTFGPAALVVEGEPIREDDPPVVDADDLAAPDGIASLPSAWPWLAVGAVGGVVATLAGVALVRRRRAWF
ncbi:MAG TPA: hypothetical protein VIY72_13765 [Acidimicrobiales bacterium]